MVRVLLCGAVAGLVGCGAPPPAATFKGTGADHDDHTHDRGKMMLRDAGNYHAGLTAHLSKTGGNELDIFFETAGKEPKPVPLPHPKLAATAVTAAGKVHELAFEPAPQDERKDDPAGQCSHYVAKAPWLDPDDVLTVTMVVGLDGRDRRVVWKAFNPRKYAHHEE